MKNESTPKNTKELIQKEPLMQEEAALKSEVPSENTPENSIIVRR
jgi:hypothetical protein